MLPSIRGRVDLRKEIQEVYLHRFVFTLALSSITVFLPLYIYELSAGLGTVFLFFGVYYMTFIFTSLPSAYLASRIGYKHTSLLSSPLIVLFYLLLRSMEAAGVQLFLVAILGGLGFNIYWLGMNSEMARSSHSGNRGKETGLFMSIPVLASIISPLMGGIILTATGYDVLFLVVAGLLAVSYIPFLFSEEHFSGMEASFSRVFSRRHLADFMTFFFRGVQSMGRKVLWPLYVGVVLTGAMNLGGVGSLMALGSAVMSVAIGEYLTEENRLRILTVGGVLFGLSWLVMSLVVTPLQAFVLSFVNGLLLNAVNVPVYSGVLGVAEKEDVLEYFAMREIGLCGGRIAVLLTMYLLFVSFALQTAFVYAFVVVALSLAGMIWFGRRVEYEG